MNILSKKGFIALFIGDIVVFLASLWIALLIRYQAVPAWRFYESLVVPFMWVFLAGLVIFFIAGLYERNTVLFSHSLPAILFRSLVVNIGLAIAYFYFLNNALAPKTILFVYSLVWFALMLIWRLFGYRAIFKTKPQNAVVIGVQPEIGEICAEVSRNHRYGFTCVEMIDVRIASDEAIRNVVKEKGATLVILDFSQKQASGLLGHFYNFLFSEVTCVRLDRVYEEMFSRVPLSGLSYDWFLQHISFMRKVSYDLGKRLMDILISLVLLVPTAIITPFTALAIKLQDGGPVFIIQDRVGKGGGIIRIPKFRSMRVSDRGKWVTENDDRITRVGKIIRKTRIDELPQLWSVLKGDLSLIGPRPDIQDLGIQLEKDIPYYAVRNFVKPGLSGWAQIMQLKPPQSLEETKIRLAYDFFYIKNRSLGLDLHIALRTVKTLLSRGGM